MILLTSDIEPFTSVVFGHETVDRVYWGKRGGVLGCYCLVNGPNTFRPPLSLSVTDC